VTDPLHEQLRELVASRSAEYARIAARVADADLVAGVTVVVRAFVEVYQAGGQALIFGNGGSAADAAHLAAEFVGRCTRDRRPLPAIALADSTASTTALANDFGFDQVFARGVQAHGRPGDLALGLSTSGRSRNVLAGLAAARELGLRTVAFTGADPGELAAVADLVLMAPSDHTGRIQEVHQLWAHVCAEAVEVALFAG
jgi:D-sedoheptulose 7-phosphate isomerase